MVIRKRDDIMLKHFVSAVTALCISAGAVYPIYTDNISSVSAEDLISGECGESLSWTLDSDGTFTIDGTGTMTPYNKSAVAEGIYPEWYEHKDKIKKIIINGSEDIADYAFYTFPEVTDVIISDSVKSVGNMAFAGCEKLKDIEIPESVNSVGLWAFYGTEWIKDRQAESPYVVVNDILIDASTKTGDAYRIPQVREIAGLAFKDTDIEIVSIPKTVEKIGSGAFMGCKNLRIVNFVSSEEETENGVLDYYNLKEIGQSAFSNCESLEKINIPPTVSRIEKNTFSDSGLKEIILGENISYIGEKAFNMCSNLEKIIIENPDCEIFDSDDTICSTGVIADELVNVFQGTICGHTDSTAQAYFEKYAVSFMSMGIEKCKFRSLDFKYLAGDANMDNNTSISDSVAILQYLANAGKYPLSDDAKINADVFNTGDGITGNDASAIQKFDAGVISKLPESFDDTYITWNSGDVFRWYPKEVKDEYGSTSINDSIKISAFPEKTFIWKSFNICYTNGTDYKNLPDLFVDKFFFADLNDDGYPEVCMNEMGTGIIQGVIQVYDLHNDKEYIKYHRYDTGYYRFEVDKDTGKFAVCEYYDLGSQKYLTPQIINDELVLN